MTSLSFSLKPDALVQLHDILVCLGKFHESVSIEAEYDLLRLSALNGTKTAYSAFVLNAAKFFYTYSLVPSREVVASATQGQPEKLSFQIYVKALLSVFKGRTSGRDKDTAVERCDVELHEYTRQAECRLVIKMVCGLGILKSYKLTYEPAKAQHAVFERRSTTHQWTIESKLLKGVIDHFSPSAELLDIYAENGKAIFTSFTTKVSDGKEILKQPVHTSVAIDKKDFEDFFLEDNIHVAINVKDFKAAISHAETVDAAVIARYTQPCQPLQLAYDFDGVTSEFTLMTRGSRENKESASSSRLDVPQLSQRQTPAPIQLDRRASHTTRVPEMPPPASRTIRPLTGTPRITAETVLEIPLRATSIEFDGLFVPADDDRQWDAPNDDEEPGDTLGWDATTDQETFNARAGPRLRDSEPKLPLSQPDQTGDKQDEMSIPPTQRISQVRGFGLFD